MSLNKGKLKADIKNALKSGDNLQDSEEALEKVANAITNAVDSYIKTATVTVTVQGIITTGSPSTQTQVAPVKATGNLIQGTGGIS
jgi:hypothetical protein